MRLVRGERDLKQVHDLRVQGSPLGLGAGDHPGVDVIGKPERNPNHDTIIVSSRGKIEPVQLRYNFRLYPTPGQRAALAQAFGCARVVFNDGLRARQEAHAAGLPYVSDGELSKRVITQAKKTPERAWLGEVSAVVLQQALADLNTAYRNFFASASGSGKVRKSPRRASGPARTTGRRFASPATPASRSQRAGDCACRRSATFR